MDPFLLIFRAISLLIVVLWGWRVLLALRQPPDWEPPHDAYVPIKFTRNTWIAAGILGVMGGLAVFALSFAFVPN